MSVILNWTASLTIQRCMYNKKNDGSISLYPTVMTKVDSIAMKSVFPSWISLLKLQGYLSGRSPIIWSGKNTYNRTKFVQSTILIEQNFHQTFLDYIFDRIKWHLIEQKLSAKIECSIIMIGTKISW